MKGAIRKLYHFAFPCRDAEETRQFYEDLLGLPLVHCMQVEAVPSSGDKGPYAHIFFEMGDGSYLVDGGTSIGDLNELLGVSIPDADWDTVGGFLFGTLEHLPEEGESIVHEGWRFTAQEMDGRRVRKVKVTLESDDDVEPGEATD